MENALWKNTVLPRYEALREDASADVLIIGGGITGILTARLLADAGLDVLLLEAARLCGGQTGGTTAKVTALHGFCYQNIAKRYGKNGVRLYFEGNMEALEKIRALASDIDCDAEEGDFCLYERSEPQRLERELMLLREIGAPVSTCDTEELPFRTVGALALPRQLLLDPLCLLSGLLYGIRVAENTPVVGLFQGGALSASGCCVRARHTVVATHFPFLRLRGGYPFKMYQSRSYTFALENVPLPQRMWADGAGKGVALRKAGDLLLFSGAGHRTGTAGGGFGALQALADAYYPGAKVVCRAAAQDCMTLDGLPYIGQYARGLSGIYVATGFKKWGMTTAMLSAMMLCDMITGRENRYTALFNPARGVPPLRFLRETGAVLRHYIRPTPPRCPHLGCALRYNSQERSWDCPCHGSRFDAAGRLLDNPAVRGLKKTPPHGKK